MGVFGPIYHHSVNVDMCNFMFYVFSMYSCVSMSLINPICIYIKQLVDLLFKFALDVFNASQIRVTVISLDRYILGVIHPSMNTASTHRKGDTLVNQFVNCST